MTVVEVLKLSTGYIEQHGSESPRLDAELLLAHVLGLRRLDLYLKFDRPLSEGELAAYRAVIARRGKGEPVAYLLGRKEFMGLEFEVTPAVLVPNPDTEVLVQRAVALAREADAARVADVGTGSGCIAVAVAHYAPSAEVWASDVSAGALEVASRNVARHGLEGRVHLAQGDLLEPMPGSFDLVCANLPYLPPGFTPTPEVAAQPAAALYADDGGAALVIKLIEMTPARLVPGGRLLAEIDPAIAGAVAAAAGRRFGEQRLHRDLAGHVRVIEAWSTAHPATGASPS